MAHHENDYKRPPPGPNFEDQEKLLRPCCHQTKGKIGYWWDMDKETFFFMAHGAGCDCKTGIFTDSIRTIASWNQEIKRRETGIIPPEYMG